MDSGGASGPATSLRGKSAGYVIAWQVGEGSRDGELEKWGSRVGGDSGDVSESVCEFGEGQGGFDGVAGREGFVHGVKLWGCRRSRLAVS